MLLHAPYEHQPCNTFFSLGPLLLPHHRIKRIESFIIKPALLGICVLRAVKKVYIWRLRIRGKAREGKEHEEREERARENGRGFNLSYVIMNFLALSGGLQRASKTDLAVYVKSR